MTLIIRQGKMGMGLEPANSPAQVIQRVGTALLYGEMLMLDLENTAYDADADDGGVFGNGITPAAAGTGGVLAVGLYWPMVLVTSGQGTASGTRVNCMAQGVGQHWTQNSGGLTGKGFLLEASTALGRQTNVRNAAPVAATRTVGFTLSNHTVAVTAELCTVYFNGFSLR